ncbi:MAG: hypothetical protein U1F76_04630 [Candidatus Competibacteraceae bacterium]
MNRSKRRWIPTDHPALAGHFPGDPIVPGMVLLENVMQVLAEAGGIYRLRGIPLVKFVAPLRPEEAFIVEWTLATEGQVQFRCLFADGRMIAHGQLEVTVA